jgi:hypothetical protein
MSEHDITMEAVKKMDVTSYCKAGYPYLYIRTNEILRASENITVNKDEGFNLFKWDCITGLDESGDLRDVKELMEFASKQNKTVIVAENLNFLFEDDEIKQLILNTSQMLKNKNVCIVIIGADHPKTFPNALKKYIATLEFPMPKMEDFRNIMKSISEQTGIEYDEGVANACLGLTHEEAENALFKSVVDNKAFNKDVIYQMKGEIIKSTGFMQYENPIPLDQLGGLNNIREYTIKRLEAYDKPELNKPLLKALFLVGVQGCGKSLFAKVLASIFDWPLIICDANAMKGGIVGETEENTRTFIKTADAFGQCIILIDEISLAFGGNMSGDVHETGGSTAGMLGTLLPWFQDRKSPAIVIATANDLNLPPAFLRAGRWDAMFFIDFPSFSERKEIVDIMNKKWNSDLPTDDDFINGLAEWSGAEIEQLAKDSLFENYKDAALGISLIKETKSKEINEVRKFGETIRRANTGSMRKGTFKNKQRTIDIKENVSENFGKMDDDFKSKIQRKILSGKE